MNETDLLREMRADLQSAPARKVLYLEGKTDLPIFFGLLGVHEPRDGVHQGVLVRGLRDTSGRGSSAVQRRVEVAGRHRYAGIYGIVDGDGERLEALAATFDEPHAGPGFRWKAYCIENLLVKTGWPHAWGTPPDWTQVLLEHAPYAALNRLHRQLLKSLKTLGLASFTHPTLEAPLRTVDEVGEALEKDKALLVGIDVARLFQEDVASVESAIRGSLDEGHAIINGKWLVDVFAPRSHGTPDRCRSEWTAHAISAGGLPEARGFWRRISARAM